MVVADIEQLKSLSAAIAVGRACIAQALGCPVVACLQSMTSALQTSDDRRC
jgi:hypothetical protein